ncbi:MAG: 50S ribosomal protein L4 [Planctomycetes bacterium]|nr:50S ribosomal protein L4 [Planctomycetota bacterium]
MLTVPIFNMEGKRTGEVQVDPEVLGRRVRPRIIKQAIVAYLDHQRQYSARTKGRSDVEGSTRKIFRQKGTGNARMGGIRNPVRRGGGCTFAKRVPGSRKNFPKKMRRLALCSALLAKIQANEALIVEDLSFAEPKTRAFASMLSALGVEQGCLVALHERDKSTYLSGRNIPDTDIRLVDDLTAYEVLRRKRLIFTGPAFKRITDRGTRSTGGR